MNNRIFKWIAIVITIIIAVFAVMLMMKNKREIDMERESMAEYADPINDQLVKLMSKRDKLQLQLDEMDDQVPETTEDNLGTVVFLFAEPKESIYTSLAPLMEKYGFEGVVALSEEYYPGVEGCLGWQQIKELEEKGWEFCISVDQVSDLDFMKEVFEKGSMDMPTSVYYPDDQCSITLEPYWLENGFENVIEYNGYVSNIREDELWHVAAYGSNLNDSKEKTKGYISESKPIVLTVGWNNNREMYSDTNFTSMLKVVKQYEDEGTAVVATMDEARARYRKHKENQGQIAGQLDNDRIEIENQIEEIDRQIKAIRGANTGASK